MTDVAIQLERQIESLNNRLEKIEMSATRNNLLFYGITAEEGENCEQRIKDFIAAKMESADDIEVEDAYQMGRGQSLNKPIKVTLKNNADKGKFFKHVKNLKDKKNELDRPYFVQSDLPERQQEEDHWQRKI